MLNPAQRLQKLIKQLPEANQKLQGPRDNPDRGIHVGIPFPDVGVDIDRPRWSRDKASKAGRDQRVMKQAEMDKQNARVNERDAFLKAVGVEKSSRNGAEQYLADVMTSPQAKAAAAASLGGGGLTLGLVGAHDLAQAYGEQSNEFLPNGPLAVVGRAVNNRFNSQPAGAGVGVDPLASARNKVNEARNLVGSEAMLEALAVDEIKQMQSENEVLTGAMNFSGDNAISRVTRDMVDARAQELMNTPIAYSDGSVRPMRYDEALRAATEQVNMEMRANNVY